MTTRPEGWGLATCLWAVAALAMGFAAVTVRAEAESLIGLAAVGHAWVAVSAAMDSANRTVRPARPNEAITSIGLGVAGAGELLGLALCAVAGQNNQAVWFGLGLSFSVVGVVMARRTTPGDGAFVGQIAFHAVVLVPIVPELSGLIFEVGGGRPVANLLTDFGALIRQFLIVVGVLIPVAFTLLMTVLTLALVKPADGRDTGWSAVLASQAAFLVALYRWSSDGL
ncbi:MAG: hypothetical protein LC745_12705 [Planctomycetia bacterium]|nr:hypothetical protein [Planctomycetia bacterium]